MNIVSYAYFRSPTSIYEAASRGAKAGMQFVQFLPMLVRAHHALWGDAWEMRVHHDDRVMELPYWRALEELEHRGFLRLNYVGPCLSLCGPTGMLARMLPVYERGSDFVACRDVDSIPSPREIAAVEEFVESGRTLHVIHDASAHSGIMGGTSTVRCDFWRKRTATESVQELISKYDRGFDYTRQGADQHLLNQLHACLAGDILIHDLHHAVGDLAGEVRTKVSTKPLVLGGDPALIAKADSLAYAVGGCSEPLAAFDWYESLGGALAEKFSEIRECERVAGVGARKLMAEIAAL